MIRGQTQRRIVHLCVELSLCGWYKRKTDYVQLTCQNRMLFDVLDTLVWFLKFSYRLECLSVFRARMVLRDPMDKMVLLVLWWEQSLDLPKFPIVETILGSLHCLLPFFLFFSSFFKKISFVYLTCFGRVKCTYKGHVKVSGSLRCACQDVFCSIQSVFGRLFSLSELGLRERVCLLQEQASTLIVHQTFVESHTLFVLTRCRARQVTPDHVVLRDQRVRPVVKDLRDRQERSDRLAHRDPLVGLALTEDQGRRVLRQVEKRSPSLIAALAMHLLSCDFSVPSFSITSTSCVSPASISHP